MPVLMTFGDSNTHGTPPLRERGEYRRYGADVRWPALAHRALGPGWELVEEGLPGRTTCFDDPVSGDFMNALRGFRMALQSHGPLDVVTVMLGTNDCKTRFGATADAIAGGLAALADVAMSAEMQARHGGFRLLVISPPPVVETGPIAADFLGAAAKSAALAARYAEIAAARGAGFLDAGRVISVSPDDGIHFEPEEHAVLASAVAAAIRAL